MVLVGPYPSSYRNLNFVLLSLTLKALKKAIMESFWPQRKQNISVTAKKCKIKFSSIMTPPKTCQTDLRIKLFILHMTYSSMHFSMHFYQTKSAVHIWVVLVPYNNSESSLRVGKSVLLQMQDLQQACEVIFHPMTHTFKK